jgi:L-ribulose-5-phosphate 4-epimerase
MTIKNNLLNSIKRKCHNLNLKLQKSNLQFQNFGNISLRLDLNQFIIKPSGVKVTSVHYKDFPVVNIKTKKYTGKLKPSSDMITHLELYKKYTKLKSIAHTHSEYGVIWSQACKKIPCLGTTHADYWLNEILVTKILLKNEIIKDYQKNIAKSIIETIIKNKISLDCCPGILVANHGPFTWGYNFDDAFLNAERLEYIAKLAYKTLKITKNTNIKKSLIEKHFYRKNGKNSYYGQ